MIQGFALSLAWRPFLDPLPIDDYWYWLLIPLVVVVSMVYKAIKSEDLSRLPRQTVSLSAQILAFLALAAAALWLLTEIV